MKVLVVEDNYSMRMGIQEILELEGHRVLCTERAEEALLQIRDFCPDLVITDLKMEGMSGIEFSEKILESWPDLLILMITAFGTVENAVNALHKGIYDFIPKPFPPQLLRQKVVQVKNHLQKRKTKTRDQMAFEPFVHVEKSLGASSWKKLKEDSLAAERFFISGPYGAELEDALKCLMGEESTEQAWEHVFLSARTQSEIEARLDAAGSFVGLEKNICLWGLETEIVQSAEETWACVQKLLKNQKIRKIWGTCSSAQSLLLQQLDIKNFSLFELNPLSERELSVAQIAEALWRQIDSSQDRLPRHFLDCFTNHRWPGNLLELKNILERLSLLNKCGKMSLKALPQDILEASLKQGLEPSIHLETAVEKLEKQYIQEALRLKKGNSKEAAELLGIPAHTLYYKLEKYDLVQ